MPGLATGNAFCVLCVHIFVIYRLKSLARVWNEWPVVHGCRWRIQPCNLHPWPNIRRDSLGVALIRVVVPLRKTTGLHKAVYRPPFLCWIVRCCPAQLFAFSCHSRITVNAFALQETLSVAGCLMPPAASIRWRHNKCNTSSYNLAFPTISRPNHTYLLTISCPSRQTTCTLLFSGPQVVEGRPLSISGDFPTEGRTCYIVPAQPRQVVVCHWRAFNEPERNLPPTSSLSPSINRHAFSCTHSREIVITCMYSVIQKAPHPKMQYIYSTLVANLCNWKFSWSLYNNTCVPILAQLSKYLYEQYHFYF